MIKTGVFGGSFNPIHKGHIALAENICRKGLVDEMWLMVSPQNPLKKNQELLEDEVRLELTRVAIETHPLLTVSDFEFHLPRPSYMIHTLHELSKTYPERKFSLIIGADNWANFGRWYKSDEILENYSLIVYPREGTVIDVENLPKNVTYIHQELYPISSTEIREKLKRQEDVSEWLDSRVEQRLKEYFNYNKKA